MQTVAGTISRVNTVTSLLKRFLSKDDSKGDSRPSSAVNNAETGLRLGTSASSAGLHVPEKFPMQIGSMKISDQVIEEVDEQMTITSMRNKEEPKPTAQSIFSNIPSPSDPVEIPGRVPPYHRFHSAQVHGDENTALFPPGGVEDLLSSSAPAGKLPINIGLPDKMPESDRKQYGSQSSEKSVNAEELDSTQAGDNFEKLRQEREAARTARQMEKMARSISAQQGIVNQIELQELLNEALKPQSTSGNSSPSAPTADAS